MISANSLRIGNLVTIRDNHRFREIVGLARRWAEFKFDCGTIEMVPYEKLMPIVLTPEILERVGFEAIPHYTVQESMTFEVGRLRYLSIGDIGTPNEMLWLCERDRDDANKVNDLICLHNYDYDDKLYLHKLQNIVHVFGIELNPLLTNGK